MSVASFAVRSVDDLKRDTMLSDACYASKYLAKAEMHTEFQERTYDRAKGTAEEELSLYREVAAHYAEMRILQEKRSKAALAIPGCKEI